MADPARCPACGSPMKLRLGDWECVDCGHIQPAQPTGAKSRLLTSTPTTASAFEPIQGTLPGGLSADDYFEQQEQSLRRQKKAIVLVYAILSVLPYGLIAAAMAGFLMWMQSATGPEPVLNADSGRTLSFIAVLLLFHVILEAISITALSYALFTSRVWVKWGCGALNIWYAIGATIAILYPVPDEFAKLASPWGNLVYYFACLLSLAFSLWIIRLMLRDIQRLRQP